MASAGRWTATAAATAIVKGEGGDARSHLIIRNRGAAAVFIGGSNVLTTTGYEISAAGTESLDLDVGETLYGISAAGGERVDWLRTS